MFLNKLKRIVVAILLSLVLVVLILMLQGSAQKFPVTFIPPVTYSSQSIPIRNDSMGEGFFGASRNGNRKHKGVDILCAIGTPVIASCPGRVEVAMQEDGMGKYVKLYHANNYVTLYGHLSQVIVESGQFVEQGRVIGKSGNSGNADHPDILPHVHFEIRQNGIHLDPITLLSE